MVLNCLATLCRWIQLRLVQVRLLLMPRVVKTTSRKTQSRQWHEVPTGRVVRGFSVGQTRPQWHSNVVNVIDSPQLNPGTRPHQQLWVELRHRLHDSLFNHFCTARQNYYSDTKDQVKTNFTTVICDTGCRFELTPNKQKEAGGFHIRKY